MLLRKAINLFLDGYFATCERSPKTVAAYTTDLRQFLEFATQQRRSRSKLRKIKPELIEEYAMELKRRGLAPASIKRKMAVLKVFFNYWVRKGKLKRSPLWLLRLDLGNSKPLPKVLSPKEMRRLLDYAKEQVEKHPPGPCNGIDRKFLALRNRAIIELMFATGIRVGEAAALRVEDIDLDQRTILIRGKGRRERLGYLVEDEAFEAVRSYAGEREQMSPTLSAFLFLCSRSRQPIKESGIALMLIRVAKQAGILRRVTPHMLRHTSATFLLQAGATIAHVQNYLGHKSMLTTRRYLHLRETIGPPNLREAIPATLVGRTHYLSSNAS